LNDSSDGIERKDEKKELPEMDVVRGERRR
jgi:hypothetical protein